MNVLIYMAHDTVMPVVMTIYTHIYSCKYMYIRDKLKNILHLNLDASINIFVSTDVSRNVYT